MEIHQNIGSIKLNSSVITIGSYDGIHRGHFHIINKVNSIFTFRKFQKEGKRQKFMLHFDIYVSQNNRR